MRSREKWPDILGKLDEELAKEESCEDFAFLDMDFMRAVMELPPRDLSKNENEILGEILALRLKKLMKKSGIGK